MPKIEVDRYNYQYLAETEELIRNHPSLFNQMCTGKTINDFNRLDIVKCTYIRGLLRVVGFTNGRVIVEPVIYTENYPAETISPEFLKNAEINKETLNLLYTKS